MARFELTSPEVAALGQGTIAADLFYELGIRYSVGNCVPTDLVAAHKWFNIAAMKGCKDAFGSARKSPPVCRQRRSPRPSALPGTG